MTRKNEAAIIKFAQAAAVANARSLTISGTKLLEYTADENGQSITYAMVETKDGKQFQAYHNAVQGYTFLECLQHSDAESCETTPAEKSSQLDSSPADVLVGKVLDVVPHVDPIEADMAVQYIRSELCGVANSFCRIGYKLREVREKKLFLSYDCKNIVEFGERLFSLKRASINNYILVCEKFSRPDKDGNPSEVLSDVFSNFSFSQLAEVMRLPEDKMEAVSPDMACKEIRALGKDESEVALDPSENPDGYPDPVTIFCRTLTKDNFDTLLKLLKEHMGETIHVEVSPA